VRAVPASAAGIEQRLPGQRGVHRDGHLPHGARKTYQLIDRLALHLFSDQKSCNLRVAGLAAEHNLHGGLGIGGTQILFGNQVDEVRQKGHDILVFQG